MQILIRVWSKEVDTVFQILDIFFLIMKAISLRLDFFSLLAEGYYFSLLYILFLRLRASDQIHI